jgi:uncharacterized protein (TIGR00290 family)
MGQTGARKRLTNDATQMRQMCSEERAAITMKPKAWLAWSSGKDSAWCLHLLRQSAEYEIVALLTTVNSAYGRVAMHAVREELLAMQAAAAGLPLVKVPIPSICTNEVYERAMSDAMKRAKSEGVSHVAFGDLFLADIRGYRESRLAACGITPIFPLWARDTPQLAKEMIAGGLSAYITCIDPAKLDRSFAGRRFDRALLADLPCSADPCGENGEFHTFANGGPMFRAPIRVAAGEVVERDSFIFRDLLACDSAFPT